ncbi:hypothetical protein SLE2022_222210 [Rubroshorea leprosula]
MADSTPFLTRSDYSLESLLPPSLDETIERCIGNFNWAQLLQAVLVSFSWFFDGQQTFISVFTDAEPSWHCTNATAGSPCNSISDICKLPKDTWSWDFPVHTSIRSEWGLECASSLVKGLPASSFFAGCLISGLLLATLADSSLGRKNMLFFSRMMMSLGALVTILSPNVWVYSALRFVNGFGRGTIGTSAIVLSTELVSKRWRGQVGVLGFFCFTFGFLSLPAIAYINEGSSWRTLYLWTSVPAIFYCILVRFFVHESPRWLFIRGRKEEAVSTLKSMSTAGDGVATMSFSNVKLEQQGTMNADLFSAIKDLVEKPWAFRRLTVVMLTGLGMGTVYYGMPLGLGNLNFNLYLSVTLNALSELPASLVTFFLIKKLGRKSSIIGFTILSGICSILCVVTEKVSGDLQMALELISFFSACTAFDVGLIYTLELFPTCVRNSALSMVRQALVLGGVFSPVLVAAGRTNGLWSFGVFGVAIGLCGLPVLILPETKGRTLSDTMDEEENKDKITAAILA